MANVEEIEDDTVVDNSFWDILEHYAVRRHHKCLTYDQLAEELGGLYSSHYFVQKKYCDRIYKRCQKEWERLKSNPDVHIYHAKEVETSDFRYIVNICKTPGFDGQKERTHLDAVFNTNVNAKGIGYIRVFSFPCKYIISVQPSKLLHSVLESWVLLQSTFEGE